MNRKEKVLKQLQKMGIDIQEKEPSWLQKFFIRLEIPWLTLKHRFYWIIYNLSVPFLWLHQYFNPPETVADVVLEGMVNGSRADRRKRARKLGVDWPYYRELEYQMALAVNKIAAGEGYEHNPKMLKDLEKQIEKIMKEKEIKNGRNGGEVSGDNP